MRIPILKCSGVRSMCGGEPTPHKGEFSDIQQDTVYAVRCAVEFAVTFESESLLELAESIYLALGAYLPRKVSLSA